MKTDFLKTDATLDGHFVGRTFHLRDAALDELRIGDNMSVKRSVRLLLFILSFIILFVSCKEEAKPELSDDKMIEVLADLHIAEVAAMSLNKKLKDSVMTAYYQQVFEIHEVTDSAFFRDLKVLRENPKRVEEIYQKVMEKVEQLGVEKIEQDSLKKK